MQWYADPGIVLTITKAEAESAHHPGNCDDSVMALSRKPRIARQLAKLNQDSVRAYLYDFGAWDSDELSDHAENLQRLLWIACGDIQESSQR